MRKDLKSIAGDLVSKTFPHLFPSLENILSVEASEAEVKIHNPVKEVVFKVVDKVTNIESVELKLQAENPDGGECINVEVEVMQDKTLNYLSDPPIKTLVSIFDKSC